MKSTQKAIGAVKLTKTGVEIGGGNAVLLCGSLFYFRLPRCVWQDRIAKIKRAGYNCVDVYFPWNYHEQEDGTFDFTGERDVTCFLEELKKAGIYVIVRPGPYICSEWNGGALPARVLESGMPIRCNNAQFLAEVEKWYSAVLPKIAPFSYSRGGNVILVQLENELDFYDCPDAQAYIGALRDIAKQYIDDLPFFCCAGQYDVARAGGLTDGVEATLNCYPDSMDPSFDGDLQRYGLLFAERGKPLLVSETNRDHFLLRRELSCGSKLLGAYNQVAGMNFGYNQAVNNWGSPDAFLATMYDFGSIIDPTGAYREEVYESIVFAAYLKTMGQSVAAALPCKTIVDPQSCDFTTTEGGLRVLSLDGGGYAVCVPNFSKEAGDIAFTYDGRALKGCVQPQNAPFWMVNVPLAKYGIDAVLTRANCEPIYIDKNKIVFCCDAKPEVGFDFGKGEQLCTKNCTVNGVEVCFMSKTAALAFLTDGNPPVCGKYTQTSVDKVYTANVPTVRALADTAHTTFAAMGIREGEAIYSLTIPKGKELFVEQPSDILQATVDNVTYDTVHANGRDMFIPASQSGKYTVHIEKWGHSNFDDSQSPSIRIASKKGAASFGIMQCREKIGRCDFRLLDTYGEDTLQKGGEIPVHIGIDKWNSTRKPVICAYTTPVTRKAQRLLLKVTEEVDVAVYIDDKKVGECDFGTMELTPYIKEGETRALTLVYRKRLWTQYVGPAELWHIDTVQPQSISVMTAKEMSAMGGKGKAISLPLEIDGNTALCMDVKVERECRVRFVGKNIKLTCVAGGKVAARCIVDWDNAPALHGGEPDEMYLCPQFSGDMYIYVQALGKHACLHEVQILSIR